MQIEALQKVTLIDYPERVAITVFTSGCNFYCCFCHNPDLITGQKKTNITEKQFFKFLKSRTGLVDGVCITGGEPTVQPDLIDFIKRIKKEGFLVKLDTNGSNPDILKRLFKENLIDYLAMDIKSLPEKYPDICQRQVNLKKVKESIKLIKNSGINYEFRTTVVPKIVDRKDIKKIGQWLKGARAYYLQQFRNENALNKEWKKVKPYSDEELKKMAKIAQPYFDKVGVRGI